MKRGWDIFCSVIDNFGDVGVCWRLARQLSSELGQSVRLWVDDLDSFHRLNREVSPVLDAQRLAGVDVLRWSPVVQIEPADIVIEGFGVHLPSWYLDLMVRRQPPPVWINLEYLGGRLSRLAVAAAREFARQTLFFPRIYRGDWRTVSRARFVRCAGCVPARYGGGGCISSITANRHGRYACNADIAVLL
jgi:hypothetical protein